jgi:RNA polymerase sigma-70 factor (ECF subfamily)
MAGEAWKTAADAAMNRYAQGDDAAFSELYELLAPRLYAFILRRTREKANAEDFLQQTFLQMHGARQHFSAGAAVMPWAFAIARRLLIDRFRRSKHEESMNVGAGQDPSQLPGRDVPPDEMASLRHLTEKVEVELAGMPEPYRAAFELIQLDGLSVAEAAEVLGTTVTAVKMRAHRAYEALRKKLGPVILEGL